MTDKGDTKMTCKHCGESEDKHIGLNKRCYKIASFEPAEPAPVAQAAEPDCECESFCHFDCADPKCPCAYHDFNKQTNAPSVSDTPADAVPRCPTILTFSRTQCRLQNGHTGTHFGYFDDPKHDIPAPAAAAIPVEPQIEPTQEDWDDATAILQDDLRASELAKLLAAQRQLRASLEREKAAKDALTTPITDEEWGICDVPAMAKLDALQRKFANAILKSRAEKLAAPSGGK